MNQFSITTKTATMTSLELVNFINLNRESDAPTLAHSDFMKKVILVIGKDAGNFSAIYFDIMNREQPCYEFPKREACLMAMSYSYDLQAKVFDRMTALESSTSSRFIIPSTLSGALRLAAEQAETIEAQALQIEASKPAVEFVDKYVDSTGLKGFRQVCKLLKANESEFRGFLLDSGIMYRLGGEWVPGAKHMDTGRFEVKAGTSDITGHAFNSAKFTPKGVKCIAGEWAKFQIEGIE